MGPKTPEIISNLARTVRRIPDKALTKVGEIALDKAAKLDDAIGAGKGTPAGINPWLGTGAPIETRTSTTPQVEKVEDSSKPSK